MTTASSRLFPARAHGGGRRSQGPPARLPILSFLAPRREKGLCDGKESSGGRRVLCLHDIVVTAEYDEGLCDGKGSSGGRRVLCLHVAAAEREEARAVCTMVL